MLYLPISTAILLGDGDLVLIDQICRISSDYIQ